MNENKNPYVPADGTELSLWSIVQLLLKKFYWLLLAGIVAAAGVYAVLTLLVISMPTIVMLVIYFLCRRGMNRKKQIEKMNIQDL